jgi:hypothetical protein
MADNVAITAGSGTSIATDEITGTLEHAQIVKLGISTDGSRTIIPSDGTNGLTVNLGTNNDVTVTNATAANLNCTEASAASILTAVQLIDDPVLADEAAFTVGTSKVNVAGFLADDASADLAAEGQAVAARTTLDRKQVVMLGESGANLVRGGGSKTDTTDQSIMGAVASKYNYLHWVAVYNASSTNTFVNVKDGSTVVAVLPLPAYGGAVFNLPVPIRSTVNTAINLAAGASVTTAYLYGGGYVGY